MKSEKELAIDVVRKYLIHHAGCVPEQADAYTDVLGQYVPTGVRVYSGELNVARERRRVMALHRLELENVMGTDERDITLAPGLTLLHAPNNAGKSTLVKALRYLLAGKPALGGAEPRDLVRHGQTKCRMRAEFEGMVVERTVEVKAVKRGKKTGEESVTCVLTVAWDGQTESGEKGEALLAQALGAPARFLVDSALVLQGEITALLDEQPGERRKSFYQFLSLDACEKTRELIAAAKRELEDRIASKVRAAELGAETLKSIGARRAAIDLARCKGELAQWDAHIQASEAGGAIVADLERQLAAAEESLRRAEYGQAARTGWMARLAELRASPALAGGPKDPRDDGRAMRVALSMQQSGAVELLTRRNAVAARGKELSELPPVCPVCRALGKDCAITEGSKADALAGLRAEWDALDDQYNAALVKVKVCQEQMGELEAAWAQFSTWEQAHAVAAEALSTHEAAEAQHVDARVIAANRDAMQAVKSRLDSARSGAALTDEEKVHIQKLRTSIADAELMDLQLAKAAEPAGADVAPLKKDQAALEQLAAAFSRSGIPLWIARENIARINEIAVALTDGDPFIYLFDEELAVGIVDRATGQAISPALVAGSGRQRGALVLLAARAVYMRERTGIDVPLLWIDEIPFQDHESMQLSLRMLRRMTAHFDTIVLAMNEAERAITYSSLADHVIPLSGEGLATVPTLPPPMSPPSPALVKAEEKIASMERPYVPANKARTSIPVCDVHAGLLAPDEHGVMVTPDQCTPCRANIDRLTSGRPKVEAPAPPAVKPTPPPPSVGEEIAALEAELSGRPAPAARKAPF